jgi:ElaB/YqjD/DUF883 family membrane-anchored ribosome-binding protein
MFSHVEIALNWCSLQLGLAPMIMAEKFVNTTTEQASVLFSGPKFFTALLAGLLMAIAFQLLLSNFAVAFGISSWGIDEESDSLGGTVRRIGIGAGLATLVNGAIALFTACFLAVKMSLVESALLGSIIGIVIWSAFFVLVVWLGSTVAGSLIGSVVSTATSGVQGLISPATAAMGATAARQQAVSTAEEITAAVRREFTSGLDADNIKNTIQESLASLPRPTLPLKEIRSQFDKLLSDVDLQSIAGGNVLNNINRQTFVDLLGDRTDLSKEDINQIADELEGAWKQTLNRNNPTGQILNLLESATPDPQNLQQLGQQLQQLVTLGVGNGKQDNGITNQAMKYGLSAVVPAVMGRSVLSNLDVEQVKSQLQKLKDTLQDVDIDKVTNQLQQLRDKATEQAKESTQRFLSLPDNTIKSDVEDYIQSSFPWHFNRITLKDEFREVIFDPDANPGIIRQQLQQLNQEYFANLLTKRGDISETRVQEIAEQMENIRKEILETVQQGEAEEQSQNLRNRIENYLRSTNKEELNPDAIERDFANLIEDPEASFEDLSNRLQEFNRDTFVQLLQQRQDINQEEANNIVNRIESTRDNVLERARSLQEQARAKADELRQKIEDYLRNTNKEELNPEGIKHDFRTLLEEPEVGINLWRERLSHFDRDTLVKLLSQRQDLSEEQVNQTVEQLESVRDNVLQAPQKVADKAKQQYEQTINSITDYLRNTNKEELNPEGIQRDLQKLVDEPKEGALALRHRLSQIDRDTLVKLLTQRGDLSEEQVNKIVDQVQQTIDNIVKAPRRFANRARQRVVDFEANLEKYLRNTNKEELNPEGIKRDLQLLLEHPRLGAQSITQRFSKFDRSTLVAVLSQREDISEEEANRIAEQIESVRNSIVEQAKQAQQKVQSVIDGVFDSIRNNLNSLNRPELNYEGIKQDFVKLFDNPQLGVEALRERLSQFDRGTLIAILSAREDISTEDANRIVNQIEAARDSVLQRTERIQQEVQNRLSDVKEQAKKQARETKKAVAGAAWWLFGTALTSLAASAIAGAMAVRGVDFLS